jgi:hypothetical protein
LNFEKSLDRHNPEDDPQMKMNESVITRFSCFILALSLMITTIKSDQNGDYFATAFSKNTRLVSITNPRIHVTTPEDDPVTFTVTTKFGTNAYTVNPQQTTTVSISSSLILTSSSQHDRTILIQAENNKTIAVYGSSQVFSSSGAFAILPLQEYDDISTYTYYAVSTATTLANYKSTLLLVNGVGQNMITITPTQPVTISPSISGGNSNVIVNPGQSYSFILNSTFSVLFDSSNDLSGTKIESSQPLTVISGHECSSVGPVPSGVSTTCDHIVQQVPPVNTWGLNHMVLPIAERTSGSTLNVMAGENNTAVLVSCSNSTDTNNSLYQLDGGEWVTFDIPSGRWCSVVGNGGILVTQYSHIRGDGESIGDTMSLSITSVEQFTNISNIVIPASAFLNSGALSVRNMLQIFIKDNSTDVNITVDNNLITGWTKIYSNGRLLGYGATVTGLSSSHHIIESSDNVFMSVLAYGFTSEFQAYGYPVNNALESINAVPQVFGFSMANYTLMEGNVYQIPLLRTSPSDEQFSVTIRDCNNNSLPGNIHINDTTVTFNVGENTQYINVAITDDNEVLPTYCVCLKADETLYPFSNPSANTRICINDNENISVVVTDVKVIEDTNAWHLELIVQLVGFEGNTDLELQVQPIILINSSNTPIHISLAPFNVYFTKYLSTATYVIPLTEDIIGSDSAYIAVNIVNNTLNIQTAPEMVNIPLPFQTTALPTPTTSTEVMSSTGIIPVTTTTSIIYPTATPLPTVTEPPSGNNSFVAALANNSTVIFSCLIAVCLLLVILVAVIVIASVIWISKKVKASNKIGNGKSDMGEKGNHEMQTCMAGERQRPPKIGVIMPSFDRDPPESTRSSYSSDNSNTSLKPHNYLEVQEPSSEENSLRGSTDNLCDDNEECTKL